MSIIYAMEFCDRLAATLNAFTGTSSFQAVSNPRTTTIHKANDWEKLALSVKSSEQFNTTVAMEVFVQLLVMFGFNVYQTNPKSNHYILLLPSEDSRYPGFLLSSRYDLDENSACMSVRAQLLNDGSQKTILGNVGGNLFFCTKHGHSAYELFKVPNFKDR